MNNSHSPSSNRPRHRRGLSIKTLAMALVISVCGVAGTSTVYAQATVGSIFGKAPAGDTVTAKSMTSGLQRDDQADAKGRYDIGHLPTGTYTVTLMQNGQPVVKHVNVPVVVGRGIKVDFDCAQSQCAELASKP
ncbi:carboxypeptidase-like regulatory domain-containing protein [Rhodanobacter ginsengiterrae]|uniref:carboxypeptidase-like regulatory domain-containing protein n=1 Tax=Rhodanobacter ginsengiterrae TaxID=2008451 RepID=UPI003CEACBE0